MAERHQQKSRVADHREDRADEQCQRQRFGPADAAEIVETPRASDDRQKRQSHPDVAVEGDVGGRNPTAMPWRAATNPVAQNKAAPTPQAMPTAVAVAAAGDGRGGLGVVNPGPFAGPIP